MGNKELQEFLKQHPDDLEIRIGSMFDPVEFIKLTEVNYNHKLIKCIQISEEEEN